MTKYEPPRYVTPLSRQPAKRPRTFWRSVLQLLMVYAGAYILCYGMEGAMRLQYHVGSLTEIEKRVTDRGARAKAIVARQKVIDKMEDDLLYEGYECVVFFGTPVIAIALLVHDIRLLNRLMRRVWSRLRWIIIGVLTICFSGFFILIGPFLGARHFYDVTSPAELLARLR